MVGFVQGEMQKMTKEQVNNIILALSAEAQLKSQRKEDERDQEKIAAGFKLLQSEDGCGSCHRFHNNVGLGTAPDLTGYGTRQWIIDFIANPAAERFYGHENERMPIFADQLTPESIALLADYLRQDWHEPAASEEEADAGVPPEQSSDEPAETK
jgi:ubiquinol-cytochrome c reductase cytochrome b subunit